MSSLQSGQSVGRYRIVRFLGAGAMGEVFLAEDPHIKRQVAIKTVRLAGRPQEIEDRKRRLLREAQAAGRLLHPNVVTLFDAGEVDGLLYLAFEFVEGEDLGSRLAAGWRPSLGQVLRIVRQTADALDFAHEQGIVHRDIKPSNILLDPTGRVKVADFGIAKMAGQSTELTMTGSVIGSPQYLSPEQIRGDELDGRSDIFSLGVVLYELLSGRRPFEGDTITSLAYQILHKDAPAIAGMLPLPARLEALLARMLEKERDERIAPAGAVAAEVAVIERELPDESLSAPAALVSAGMGATHVLPRRTPTLQEPVVPPPPPPSPSTLSSPSPRPAPPPPLPTMVQAGPPPLPPAVSPAGASASPLRWILPLGLVLILALAGVYAAWKLVSRFMAPKGDEQTAAATSEKNSTAATPAPAVLQGTPPGTPSAATPGTPPPVTTTTPRPMVPAATPAPPPVRETAPPGPSPRETPAGAGTPRQQLPTAPPQDRGPAMPRPGGDTTPSVESPSNDRNGDDDHNDEPAAPAREAGPAGPPADRTIRTGLSLTFQVTPPDAFILVDRTTIGQAKDWSGGRKGRPYILPGAGSYRIRVRKEGMKEYRLQVEAGETGGVTPVTVQLQPLPAADVETSDLRQVQVREAVAFRVDPPGAMVSIDGQPEVPARQYGGGLGRGGWLTLTPGRHRLSFSAPGRQRQDVAVEVTAAAEEEREKIVVKLRP